MGIAGLAGLLLLLLPFIRCRSVMVKFSFSYNTLFLSSLNYMVAQYTPSSIYLILFLDSGTLLLFPSKNY